MSWTTIGAEDESLSLVGCARNRMTVPSPRHTPTGKDIAALCPSQVRASPALSFPDRQQPLSSHSAEGFARIFILWNVHFFTAQGLWRNQ